MHWGQDRHHMTLLTIHNNNLLNWMFHRCEHRAKIQQVASKKAVGDVPSHDKMSQLDETTEKAKTMIQARHSRQFFVFIVTSMWSNNLQATAIYLLCTQQSTHTHTNTRMHALLWVVGICWNVNKTNRLYNMLNQSSRPLSRLLWYCYQELVLLSRACIVIKSCVMIQCTHCFVCKLWSTLANNYLHYFVSWFWTIWMFLYGTYRYPSSWLPKILINCCYFLCGTRTGYHLSLVTILLTICFNLSRQVGKQ